MKKLIFAALFLSSVAAYSQQSSGRRVKSGFGVTVVQKQPQYAGGQDSLNAFLNRNINYPLQARLNNIQGRVYVGFMITAEGKVTDIRLLSGVNEELDQEAIRVTGMMPDWKPGTIDGKPVSVQYILPIDFVIPTL